MVKFTLHTGSLSDMYIARYKHYVYPQYDHDQMQMDQNCKKYNSFIVKSAGEMV